MKSDLTHPIFNDISAEQALEQIKISLDSAQVGLAQISFDGYLLWANSFYLNLIGYRDSEIKNLNLKDFMKPEEVKTQMNLLEEMRLGRRESLELDKLHYLRDGTYSWVNVSARLIRNKKGSPQHVIAIIHDFNKRKESENLLRLVLKALPSLVSYIDKDLIYRFVNASYEKWFGLKSEEILGRRLPEIIGELAFAEAKSHVSRVLKGEYTQYKRRLNYLYGGAKDVNFTLTPDFNPIGEVLGFVAVVSEVPEAEKNEDTAIDNPLLESAKAEAMSYLAGSISHQMSHPLQMLNESLENLQLQLSQLHSKEHIEKELNHIKESSLEISRVLRGLNSFTADNSKGNKLENSLMHIIEDTIAICGERFKNKGVELLVENMQNHRIFCNSAEISQVLLHLINNSFEAIESLSDKWIRIASEVEPHRILISVTDSGSGLAPDVVKRLMTPFFSTKEHGRRSGLGLSNSRDIAERHGGKLLYDSSCQNTRFIFELPRISKHAIIDMK